jgi:DNA-binding beta-propeller fold protein YncE
MKTNVTFLMLAFAAVIFLSGCESDNDPAKQDYKTGVLILNEGGFGAGNGTIDHYDPSSGAVHQNIFQNTQGFAGDVVQSLTISNEQAYLVLNGDNKIEITDNTMFTGENTFTAPALDKPRYVEVIDGKAYISVWGKYDDFYSLIDSYVLVMNTQTLQVVDTIDTDEGVENLLYNGEYLFASNYNFGGSSTLAIIDPSDNTLVDQIELAAGPAGMVLDKNGKLWVITSGTYQGNNGKLFRINTTTLEVEDEIELGVNPATDLSITPDKSNLVYSAGSNIYKMSITADAAPAEEWIEAADVVALYALGIDPETGEVYVGDALNYATAGKVYVYKADGTFKTSFTTGISPTQFVFRP